VKRLCPVALAAILVAGGCGSASRPASTTTAQPQMFVTRKNGYGSLKVVEGGKTRTLYRSNDSCCTNLVVVTPTLVAFDDDYNAKTIDLATDEVHRIAGFSNFVVAPDGRWVAGWADSGGHSAQLIGVVSINGNACLTVPKPKWADDSGPYFSADSKRLFFARRRFDPVSEEDTGPGYDLSVLVSKLPRSQRPC
jgi:tricorn protease-like protein